MDFRFFLYFLLNLRYSKGRNGRIGINLQYWGRGESGHQDYGDRHR